MNCLRQMELTRAKVVYRTTDDDSSNKNPSCRGTILSYLVDLTLLIITCAVYKALLLVILFIVLLPTSYVRSIRFREPVSVPSVVPNLGLGIKSEPPIDGPDGKARGPLV